MKKYNSPEIELVEAIDVVSTSSEVETEKIPLYTTEESRYQL